MPITPPLSLSPRGLALLKSFEKGPNGSFAASPYRDSGSKLTIGWGHLIKSNEKFDRSINEAEAERILRTDISIAEIFINATTRVSVSQAEFDGLVLLVFNIGVGQYDKSTLRRCLNAGDRAGVAIQWMRWVHDNGKRVNGLFIRRTCDLMLFQNKADAAIAATRLDLERRSKQGEKF